MSAAGDGGHLRGLPLPDGFSRSFFTGKNAVRSGLELTLVGSVVAVITYGVGVALRTA
jgi:VIT1/CCC1 family predicted Fe2+/Mn2+ transporter